MKNKTEDIKLSKRQVSKVLSAIRMIENEKEAYCCFALRGGSHNPNNSLVSKFGEFYEKDTGSSWFRRKHGDDIGPKATNARITLLVNFLICCGKEHL